MNKMKKLALAVLAAVAMSGCASTRTAELAGVDAVPALEHQVMRPLQSYGTMGGYRYRRFAAVAVPS
jgi:PBP1b-binding outer membrane lipoprotein LpoB